MSDADSDLLRTLQASFGDLFADLRASLPRHTTNVYARRSVETIRKIVLHHSATPTTTTWSSIASYHVNDKDHDWPGIGYHFGVEDTGQVVYVGDVETIRYHARQANTASIGVCCLGDYQKTAPAPAMLDSLALLIALLDRWHMRWTGGPILSVTGHRDEADTTCPGDALYAALGNLEDRMEPQYDIEERLLAEAERQQVIQFNPAAALQSRIFAAGFVPNSPEFRLDGHAAQRAEHLGTGEVRVYYAREGDWQNVAFVTRPSA
jgi:hypothetical protein